jgi:hypothetical protein
LVLLEVSPDEGRYLPRSYAHPEIYRDEICLDTERAQAAAAGGADWGWDGTPKCEVLPLVLDYLYSGDPDAAWDALETYYRFPDRDAFRAEIEAAVGASPYFATPSR